MEESGPTQLSLYLLIWDFLLSQINIWTTTTWSNVWVVLPKPFWYEFLIGFLIWRPASKYLHLTTFSNICVIYPCSYICNCLKMLIKSQSNEYSDLNCLLRISNTKWGRIWEKTWAISDECRVGFGRKWDWSWVYVWMG